jgi:Mg/Co/Ni transporter MgtE
MVLIDKLGHFAGTAPVARMLLAAPDQHMNELRTEPLVSITVDGNDKDVFELFDKYNLRMLTVLDNDNRPVGVVTVDDVVSRLVNA